MLHAPVWCCSLHTQPLRPRPPAPTPARAYTPHRTTRHSGSCSGHISLSTRDTGLKTRYCQHNCAYAFSYIRPHTLFRFRITDHTHPSLAHTHRPIPFLQEGSLLSPRAHPPSLCQHPSSTPPHTVTPYPSAPHPTLSRPTPHRTAN
jgi:hypothetical protein